VRRSKEDFSNRDLRRSNFTNASLKKANFTNAKLQGAYFIKVTAAGTNFTVHPPPRRVNRPPLSHSDAVPSVHHQLEVERRERTEAAQQLAAPHPSRAGMREVGAVQ
jgi:hypothetical protein